MDINGLTATNIKKLRLSTGKSQDIIAEEMEFSSAQYGRIENGKIDINLRMLERIADYYQKHIMDIIGQKSDRSSTWINPKGIQNGDGNTLNLNVSKEEATQLTDLVTKIFKS
jgi:transcriptional regulator with XRE-family HTH domain